MKKDKAVVESQQRITDGNTEVFGQITNVGREWTPLDVFRTTSMAKQFIGSYRYDGFVSKDKKRIYNVISDTKSRTSFFLHLPLSNKSRSESRAFSTTYQFYIWESLIE